MTYSKNFWVFCAACGPEMTTILFEELKKIPVLMCRRYVSALYSQECVTSLLCDNMIKLPRGT
jgi:hypothetical protein